MCVYCGDKVHCYYYFLKLCPTIHKDDKPYYWRNSIDTVRLKCVCYLVKSSYWCWLLLGDKNYSRWSNDQVAEQLANLCPNDGGCPENDICGHISTICCPCEIIYRLKKGPSERPRQHIMWTHTETNEKECQGPEETKKKLC